MGIQILNKDVSVISSVMGKAKASIGSIFGKTGWSGGGGADVTPNPTPNWADISIDENTGLYTTAVQQVQGISSPITLELSINNASFITIYYKVDGSAPSWTNGGTQWDGNSIGWTQIISFPVTFSVSNNQYVSFGCTSLSLAVIRTLTVKNNSDGAATLDTFTATVTTSE
mgnify:CR=1 FL=1